MKIIQYKFYNSLFNDIKGAQTQNNFFNLKKCSIVKDVQYIMRKFKFMNIQN